MYQIISDITGGMPLQPTTVASVDSYTLAAVILLFIILCFNARHVGRLFQNFVADVWTVRQRDNIFEEHVAAESRTLILMILFTSVLEGILLFSYFSAQAENVALINLLIFIGIAIGFNVFSIAGCSTLGYTFTSHALSVQWRRGLLSSQALLGLFLLLPTIIIVVRPNAVQAGMTIGVVMYILARILYIIKGIRIFHTDFFSWLYFILYLCTLEIIPLLVIWRLIPEIGL